jgi:hypothetical protein
MPNFSFGQINKEQNNSKPSRLTPGIHLGCTLTKFGVDQTVNGNQFFEYEFTKKDENRITRRRIWFPNGKNNPRDGETQDQANEREIGEKIGTLIQVLEQFVTSEDLDSISVSSFEQACEVVSQKLAQADTESNLLNIKLIYDSNGVYAEFPRYGKYVERFVEGQNSNLRFSKYEKENRMTPAEVIPGDSPAIINNSNNDAKPTEELPF